MKYTTWLKIAAAFQLLTAIAHSLSFIIKPVGTNDTERHLLDLMNNYLFDFGAGYHHSMSDILNALSACFSLLYFFAAATNWYLIRQNTDTLIMRGVIVINLAIFGFAFALFVILTFLPPIILTGLVFFFLLMAAFKVFKVSKN